MTVAIGKTAHLRDVAQFIRGITFKPKDVTEPGAPGTVVCMRTKNVQSTLDESDLIAVPRSFVRSKSKMLREGDVLVSTANSFELVGKCCWVPGLDYEATAGGFISIFRSDEKCLYPRYFYHWLTSPQIQHVLRYCGRQTTNISNLSYEIAGKIEVPLPPLAEQKRIAAILDKAGAIRRKRQQALALADQFLQSVFLDMFGDPVTNPKGWEERKFGDHNIGTLDRGRSRHRPRNAAELLGGPYPLVQTGNVANCRRYLLTYDQTYSEVGLRQSKMWPAGTLCITIAANIAKTGILKFDACFPDSVVGFTPAKGVRTEYVQFWLSFLQKLLEDCAPESAQKNINLEILRKLDIPLPPSDIQNKFAAVVKSVDGMVCRMSNAESAGSDLLNALVNCAFNGKLQ